MCGITGVYRFDEGAPELQDVVVEMTTLLSHRGPDGSGIEAVGHVTFGHRRLSIIDLSTGAQPLWSHDKAYLITFNGEIYNYKELRTDLEKIGHKFITQSDTEVIVELFRRWGVDAFPKLNGQFAFGLYDCARRTLHLVRDSIGEKPLYYTLGSEHLAFASEVKSLVRFKRIRSEQLVISPTALSDYLSLNYIPGEECMIGGVRKVKPGHFLTVSNGKISERSYIQEYSSHSENSSDLNLEAILRESVKIRLRSDVPLGVFLSSGVDSALAALMAKEVGSGNYTAFTANFIEPSFSEAQAGKAIAKRLDLPHEIIDINVDDLDLPAIINKLVYHGDEPLADSSALPVYLLSKATSSKVKVVLSGDGGDELFGGYLTYKATLLANRLPKDFRQVLYYLKWLPQLLPATNGKVTFQEKLTRFLGRINMAPAAAHFAWNGMFSCEEKLAVLGTKFRDCTSRDTFQLLAERFVSGATLSQAAFMKADQMTYLPNDILAKTDRMSMAHGLEVRPVYLDPAIINFSRKMSLQRPELFKDKLILRNLLKQKIGANFLPQKKLGFSIPIHSWFRTKLRSFFNELLLDSELEQSEMLNFTEVKRIWQAHLERKKNYGFELWGIMVFMLWYRGVMLRKFD